MSLNLLETFQKTLHFLKMCPVTSVTFSLTRETLTFAVFILCANIFTQYYNASKNIMKASLQNLNIAFTTVFKILKKVFPIF